MTPNAIGIVRVSQVAGREGESFHSPQTQRGRIEGVCETHSWGLLRVHEELDVSGARALEDRPGLLAAVEAIEAGEATILAAAYLDRLTREPRVRDEVLDRVEAAGGQVWTVDMGRQTNRTAAEQLTGTVASAVNRYIRRAAAERSAEAQQRAIARGVVPWPNVPPGYRRRADGVLEPEPRTAAVVAEGFQLRADGATIMEVRALLASHGIKRSFHGVQALLRSRVVLGEIHFGGYEPNLAAHAPIVGRDVWQAAQRAFVARGRRPKSDRLLARLGVLRCATCNARMVVGGQTQHGRHYADYRCPPVGDCPRRVAISAALIEPIVVEAVKAALADVEGRASYVENVRAAEARLEAAQAELDAAIRVLHAVGDEPAALERIIGLRDARDGARAEVDHLGGESSVVLVNAAADWDRLSLDGRRALIRAVVARVLVEPGRGPGRVRVELVGEHPAGL